MVALKLPATTISRTQQDITRLKREIASSETDLVTSGSTKTREDVQVEIDGIKNDMFVLPLLANHALTLTICVAPLSIEK